MKLPDALRNIKPMLQTQDPSDVADYSGRRAAVLLLLYPVGNHITFALTQRPESLSRHPGQISLPGGMMEPHDATLWHTAVRETQEELGFRSGRMVPLGRLNVVTPRISNSAVTPFVAWNPVRPKFRPDFNEVAEVMEIPLDLLLEEDSALEETWDLLGSPHRVTFFRFGERAVWGMTALVLEDFRTRLVPLQRTPRPGSVYQVK